MAATTPTSRSAAMRPKPPVSILRWLLWYLLITVALVIFYGLFTPFWFALRSLAWLAEFRSRRRAADA